MPNHDKDQINKYLANDARGQNYVDKLPENDKQILAIVRYQFNELIPSALRGRCGEHYGYSDNPNKVLPVPYVASEVPSPTAEFAFPYLLLDYAVLTLERKGPSTTLITKIIKDLQSNARKEMTANPRLALTATRAYKDFTAIAG